MILPSSLKGAGGYSLWIIPAGKTYEKLVRIIDELSKRYSTPVFEPHVTVVKNIKLPEQEMIAKTSQLAAALSPYAVILIGLEVSMKFYTNLVAKADKTHELMEASRKARQIFYQHQLHPYDPHLSLIYGNLSRSATQRISKNIKEQIQGVIFQARSIHVVVTAGRPENWRRIKELPFDNIHVTSSELLASHL
ncbi:2'-5' RNA ligase family protein [Patescibacteria group bacterium]|nr:2'-5' RNA ligase family protein [Patescibacteria group bacterium]